MTEIPVNITLRVDAFLLHLIQQTTNESSVEILAFFNGLGKEMARIGCNNRKKSNQSIRKVIHDYYPNSVIPIQFLVTGRQINRRWIPDDPNNPVGRGTYEDHVSFSATVEVSFPSHTTYFDSKKVDEVLIEKLLLDGVDMEPFPKPETKTPKMLKKLMESVKTSTESTKKHQDDE